LETISESLEEMVIESTFSNVKPTSCSQWFKDCANLTTITGLSNLNTSEITDISGMLQNCSSLESLTLGANFDTSGLNSYSNLFSGSSIADGNAVLTIDGATISQDDFFASITNGQLVRNVSDDEVDKGSANAGLYTWKGGKFVTYNGKALLTLGSTSNGSIAITSGETAISESLYEATPNTTITLSVTPDTRYKLKTLTYNDNDITNNSFDMPAGPVTVSATFIADFDPVDTTKDYDASTNPYAIRTVADYRN
jgi:surface protein